MKKFLLILAMIPIFMITLYFSQFPSSLISVNETFITSKYVPAPFNGVRIVQFSDTFIGDAAGLIQLENTIDEINRLNPDIVIFTGNLLATDDDFITEQVEKLLSQIEVNIGRVSIFGQHDILNNTHRKIIYEIFSNSGFIILNNESVELFNQDAEGIIVIGAAPTLTRNELETLLEEHSIEDRFNLLLINEPTFSSVSTYFPIRLQLSGHCLGSNFSNEACFQFYSGIYSFANKMTLNVNNGMARLRPIHNLTRRPIIDSFLLIKN